MSDLVSRARAFATGAHQRVDLPLPYRSQPRPAHLKAVAGLAALVTDDEEVIAAAWLHDLVEGTPTTLEDVTREFGTGVGGLVSELILVSRPSDGSPTLRNEKDVRQIAEASQRAKIVVLADMIDTARDYERNRGPLTPELLRRFDAIIKALEDGESRLVAKLHKVRADIGRRFERQTPTEPIVSSPTLLPGDRGAPAVRVFLRAFKAADIAEPLISFGQDRSATEVASILAKEKLEVAGLRHEGRISGAVLLGDLTHGICADHLLKINNSNTVEATDPLADVIVILTRRSHCFVRSMGEISGVISRNEIQKPVVRMWLFGIITLSELAITERIRQQWPDDSWQEHLSPGRLRKAQALLVERERNGQQVSLVDCLQLADKFLILASRPEHLALLGIPSRGLAKQTVRELESLRNNLAHAQDIVTHDWAQIVRLSQRMVQFGEESG